MAQQTFFTKIPDRGLIRISGPDRRKFLQGLVSNDVNLVDSVPCVYACFLTPQGKFLHDMFITEESETLILDVEGGERASDLCQRLQVYKLRANVEIEVIAEASIYAISSPHPNPPPPAGEGMGGSHFYPDPRHPKMGFRSIYPPHPPASRVPPSPPWGEGWGEGAFDIWDRRRIELGVPDGSRDMIPQKSTLLESNIDKLSGISWKKGCYMGQELTARMHYRGLAKKHLYPVRLNEERNWKPGDAITHEGKVVGEMRSRCGDVGMALLKDEVIEKLEQDSGYILI